MRRIDVPVVPLPIAERGKAAELVPGPLGAADYALVFEDARPHGEVVARIGDTTLPLERWQLDGLPGGQVELPIRLPVPVSSLKLYGDDAAIASLKDGHLHLAAVRPSATSASARARRAARFGEVRTFFLDDRAYPEPAGFWTQGGATTRVLLDRGAVSRFDQVAVTLQSGPVALTVDVSIQGQQRQVPLRPSERKDVVFQFADGDAARALSIRTDHLFRPVQHDAASGDYRPLGVWVEVR